VTRFTEMRGAKAKPNTHAAAKPALKINKLCPVLGALFLADYGIARGTQELGRVKGCRCRGRCWVACVETTKIGLLTLVARVVTVLVQCKDGLVSTKRLGNFRVLLEAVKGQSQQGFGLNLRLQLLQRHKKVA
jgi:hypothetical protein